MGAIRHWLLALALGVAACAQDRPERVDNRESAYQENNRGVAELEQYTYDKAAESFRRAIAIDERVALPHVNLAIALLLRLEARRGSHRGGRRHDGVCPIRRRQFSSMA